MTEQQKALSKAQTVFGMTAWTADHINYRQVGCFVQGQKLSSIGETWDGAIEELKGKVQG